jgi:flagellar protein FliO/FliZ
MFETLFGSEMPLAARFFIAFLVVLALIGLTAWLVRRFGSNRLGGAARGRQPRLAVIDAATVDGRRRLVLIRRDNVEHLLMIGGPTDVVVEPNIVRATGAREMARASVAGEPANRQSPTVEGSWPLQPLSEPTSIPAPRPYRSSATEEPWLAPEPGARPRPADSLTGLAAELSTRLTPPEVAAPAAPAARSEPAPRAAVAPAAEPAAPTQTDHNLAEMAQQLEAALRRAPMPESRPPVTDPLAAPQAKATPARDNKPRVEPKIEPKIEAKVTSPATPKAEPKFEPKPELKLEPVAAPAKGAIDNLEEEMANLLGRPPGKT